MEQQLIRCAEAGNLAELRRHLEDAPDLANTCDNDGCSLLYIISSNANREVGCFVSCR